MRHAFTYTLIAALLAATHARAQTVIINNGNRPPLARLAGDNRKVNVTANFSVALPLTRDAKSTEMTKEIAAATEALFDIVNRQCDLLAASLKGTCRLIQLNTNGNIGNRGVPNNQAVAAGANATFEIDLTPAAATPTPDTPR